MLSKENGWLEPSAEVTPLTGVAAIGKPGPLAKQFEAPAYRRLQEAEPVIIPALLKLARTHS